MEMECTALFLFSFDLPSRRPRHLLIIVIIVIDSWCRPARRPVAATSAGRGDALPATNPNQTTTARRVRRGRRDIRIVIIIMRVQEVGCVEVGLGRAWRGGRRRWRRRRGGGVGGTSARPPRGRRGRAQLGLRQRRQHQIHGCQQGRSAPAPTPPTPAVRPAPRRGFRDGRGD